jgi:hypothetical protein
MRLDGVLDVAMRTAVIPVVMAMMLFSSIESAVDAAALPHHDTNTSHEIHHGPGPEPEHDDGDCSHFCHCTAHLPSIAVNAQDADMPPPSSRPPEMAVQHYASRSVAPPLRPPTT